ncbi:MAG: sugar transferase [Anaerohalosphaeraceae bacterium]|nr:sugar transferase [Anaerohalosphaeraceae bacterium]
MKVQILVFLINIILINASFLLAFLVRYGVSVPAENFQPYRQNFIVITFIYLLAFFYNRLFKKRFRSHWKLLRCIFLSICEGTFLCISFFYVFRTQFGGFPSSVFVLLLPVSIIVFYAGNTIVLRTFGRIKRKVVIIGQGEPLEILEKSKRVEKQHIDNLSDLLHYDDIDEVVILENINDDKQLNLLTYLLLKLKVNVVFGPAIYAKLLSANMMDENDLQFLATFIGRKSDSEEALMRALDLFGSLAMLIISSPLMAIVAIVIKLTSRGPVFYRQLRVTKDGEEFTLCKFRTMVDGAEKSTGPVWASENDLRVTKIGRFLRDSRIDEIPQLLNVIKGDMSLVGPRPERPHFIKMHKHLRETRLAVKPGLTGFAQIRSYYDLHPKHKIKYDYLYIQRRSFLLNLYILMMTIPVMVSRKGQ